MRRRQRPGSLSSGTSLVPELRKAHELELLTHYQESLLAQGVSGFSLQECIDD